MNVMILMGRLTKSPELKTTNSGISVTSFTVAVNRSYSKGCETQTDFINCVAWRNTAEFITKYFTKGQMIAIKGSLQQRSYEDKNGNKRTSFDVLVDTADFCGGKSDKPTADVDYQDASTAEYDEVIAEDLPF